MGRVVHFEIHASDCDRAERFYREVFGWRVERWKGAPADYRLVHTGAREQPGIDGAITERRGSRPPAGVPVAAFVCTVEVDDVADVEARVERAGGRQVVERQEIPGVGEVAYFQDTEGNVVGALQPAPVATSAPLREGERVVLEAEATGRSARHGTISEVLRPQPPRYRVRWDDGHESIYTPSAGALAPEAAGRR
jgi:predicted enzyme related to lactoylglutathione lyase